MLENILSNLLLILIAIFGFSYMSIGKPKNKTVKINKKNGEEIYIRKSNFTKKVLFTILLIVLVNVILTAKQ
ncbi:hypothetical protein ACQPUY_06220 [Clostridium nigeriense]|uniref:hypothetical protein n=1 Tax=Clostridium nigeriense TaxID=1805470 RepID=UPI003D33525A